MPDTPTGHRLVPVLKRVLYVGAPVLRSGDNDTLAEFSVPESCEERCYVVKIDCDTRLAELALDGY